MNIEDCSLETIQSYVKRKFSEVLNLNTKVVLRLAVREVIMLKC